MSDFLPYQESLILHEELGFNEPCYAVYSEHDQTRVYDNDSIKEGKIIPALLYQQAFRFFREKYGLFVAPSAISYEGGPHLWFFEINSTTIPFGTDLGITDDFNTYEEAELACLIKLIEIVKNKNKI